jgi:uncharacterized protein YybS (DUF2232 family)
MVDTFILTLDVLASFLALIAFIFSFRLFRRFDGEGLEESFLWLTSGAFFLFMYKSIETYLEFINPIAFYQILIELLFFVSVVLTMNGMRLLYVHLKKGKN